MINPNSSQFHYVHLYVQLRISPNNKAGFVYTLVEDLATLVLLMHR